MADISILGIKVTQTHDNGAALLVGDQVVAVAQERLDRRKHSSAFPMEAVDYCFEYGGVNGLESVDLVVTDMLGDAFPGVGDAKTILQENGLAVDPDRLRTISHHDAHAASAFFPSPYDKAAVLVLDGAGTSYPTQFGKYGVESETVYVGQDHQLRRVHTNLQPREIIREWEPYSISLGKLYTLITRVLGCGYDGEGKVMGLASYGTGALEQLYPPDHWSVFVDGQIFCNPSPFPLSYYGTRLSKIARRGFHSRRNEWRWAVRRAVRWLFRSRALFSPSLFDLSIPSQLRAYVEREGSFESFDFRAEMAYTLQKILETMLVSLAHHAHQLTGMENLCIAGGVGLNCVANKKILDETPFKRIWVQPAANDSGIPLGCALYGKHMELGETDRWQMRNAYLGRRYREDEIKAALREPYFRPRDLVSVVARLLADGNIIGWFHGESEYGPRALGHRSILCDPRSAKMKDILNDNVKHRESYRPFAPSVLLENSSQFFDLECSSPHMLLAADVHPAKRDIVPAITHVDGTARVQTVTAQENGKYYELIDAFKRLTGVPILLNTSFNLAGDPIVETPTDAVECFYSTGIDYLVMEDYVLGKDIVSPISSLVE